MRYPDGACILSAHIKALKHRKNSRKKKLKQSIFFFTILTLASFWKEIRRGFSVLGGVDRLRVFPHYFSNVTLVQCFTFPPSLSLLSIRVLGERVGLLFFLLLSFFHA